MRVLVATNMYPHPDSPTAGAFVLREVEAIRRLRGDWDIEVLRVDTVAKTSRYLTGIRDFRQHIQRFLPDVVHVHYGLSLIFSMATPVPRAVTFHGSDLAVPWQRYISTGLLRRDDAPIVVAHHMLDSLRPDQRTRARVVPCGVDTTVFNLGDESPRPPVQKGSREIVIGFPADPTRKVKCYGLFQQVVGELRRTGSVVRVVELTGIVPRDMPGVLRSLDLLLMTSEREGSPVVTREALCCGTRVVSVDVGDVAEQVMGLSGCRIAMSRAHGDIASACEAALGELSPDSRVAMGRFAVEREAEAVIRLYQELTGDSP